MATGWLAGCLDCLDWTAWTGWLARWLAGLDGKITGPVLQAVATTAVR